MDRGHILISSLGVMTSIMTRIAPYRTVGRYKFDEFLAGATCPHNLEAVGGAAPQLWTVNVYFYF